MKLDELVPWGRSLAEYSKMFALSEADLNTKILGCGDGPASFNAEMTEQGYAVTSIDPIYQFSAEQIRQRVQATYEPVISQVKQNADRYVWKDFRDADELGQVRLATMEKFLSDYAVGKAAGRYQCQALPSLAFADGQFELCLCSHLLFLYSELRSLNFHLASIQELLRVSQELRIFPLVMLNSERSPYLEPIIQEFTFQGFDAQIQPVSYEFQKGGRQMLKISQPGA
ncbi:SAM-dependent methyltransferase [Romeria aff. gracilis LEGE 07310]|uniref:SAM-dependent methyltransferase n=1 Tax=Vasconcelosia minhoensis LEGE 07310 TaxID=915328 RepID=A0A8J7AEL1_9CYAN|nr:SAM-dependent methyltransferase [Romeria gracilis]MBE9075973.1 SAM-dependent methyltransferase [Romeria aff. gracilis LEGE 07310]